MKVEHSDWEKLKSSSRFKTFNKVTGELHSDRASWDRYTALRGLVRQSNPYKGNLPVYYPGSGSDIAYPLVVTDASRFVFVDYLYVNNWESGGMDALHFLLNEELPEIGAEITSDRLIGYLGQGGKRVVNFNWSGRERELTLYAEDATRFTPNELRKGIMSAIIKAPTPVERGEGDTTPGAIYSQQFKAKMYKSVVTGGFINWRPVNLLNPELVGFKSVDLEAGYPTHQKIKDVPKRKGIVELDESLMMSISLRDGTVAYSIGRDSLKRFEKDINHMRKLYLLLDAERQEAILPILQGYLSPTEVTVDYLEQLSYLGRGNGIDTQDKALDYLRATIGIFTQTFCL